MLKSGLLANVVIVSLIGGLTLATGSPFTAHPSTSHRGELVEPPAQAPEDGLVWPLLASCLAFLIPAGFTLLASGGMPEEKAVPTAMMGLAATWLALAGYLACGFALQFGGIGLVSDLPGLKGLIWEWSPLDVTWGTGWGTLGLRGFFLQKGADTPMAYALFFSQLPLVITASLIPLLTLRRRARSFVLVLGALLIAALVYPFVGNWVWGGGWLANLGSNLEMGHGFVDFAGSGMVHLLGGVTALGGIVALGFRSSPLAPRVRGGDEEDEPARMPPAHLPLLAILGSLLLLVGWLGLVFSNPLYMSNEALPTSLIAVNVVLAAGGSALVAMLYTWFATGRADVLMTARGMAAGLVAISAACPFVPPWAALIIGAVAGLLLPLGIYFVEYLLRLDDPAAAIAIHGLSGLWGLLALAIFADGRYGAGWNGIGAEEYLGIAGQGVSGSLVASGFQLDLPNQLYAQLVGTATITIVAFTLAWAFFKTLDLIIKAWTKTPV
jgi:Amt family ammonium transporter